MKRCLLIFLFILAAMLQSCVYDYGVCEDAGEDGSDVQVTFTLSLSGGNVTRAGTYADPYDEAEGVLDENKIESLQVYLYERQTDADGVITYKFVKKVDEISYKQTSTSNIYQYSGTLKITDLNPDAAEWDSYDFSGRVVVLANCDEYTPAEGSLISDFNPDPYTYKTTASADGTVNSDVMTSIPMWGVTTVTGQLLRPQYSTDFGDIYLLRAMAKVEIGVTQEFMANGFSITSVTLSKYNTAGSCLPYGAAGAANTKEIYVEGCMNLPSALTAGQTLAMKQGDNWYIYMPEIQTAGDSDTYMTVTISKNGSTATESYDLFFTTYDADNTIETVKQSTENVVRNHYWQFVINKDVEIIVNATVAKWQEHHNEYVIM